MTNKEWQCFCILNEWFEFPLKKNVQQGHILQTSCRLSHKNLGCKETTKAKICCISAPPSAHFRWTIIAIYCVFFGLVLRMRRYCWVARGFRTILSVLQLKEVSFPKTSDRSTHSTDAIHFVQLSRGLPSGLSSFFVFFLTNYNSGNAACPRRENPKQWSNEHNDINLSQALKVNSHSQFKSHR